MVYKVKVLSNKYGIDMTIIVDSKDADGARSYAMHNVITGVVGDALLNPRGNTDIINSTLKDLVMSVTTKIID